MRQYLIGKGVKKRSVGGYIYPQPELLCLIEYRGKIGVSQGLSHNVKEHRLDLTAKLDEYRFDLG